jgi:hypothetical protein
MDAISQQRLDILAGTRTAASLPKAAVRREDLAALVTLAAQTSTKLATGATITVANYNAVVADLAAIYQAISQIAARVKT